MRLPVFAAPLLLLAAPASSADPRPAADTPVINPNGTTAGKCPATSPYHAMKDREKPAMTRLNELPPAVHYKAAYRRINGCEVPIIAGYGIGSTDNRRPPKR
jgi:hypothetical protein